MLVGSLLATITALFARGTALETDVRLMATDVYHQVRAETLTVDGAEALLEAARPRIRWWKFGRVRRINRSLDAGLDTKGAVMTRSLEHAHDIVVPTGVTAGQVQLARFRLLRDERGSRPNRSDAPTLLHCHRTGLPAPDAHRSPSEWPADY